MSDDKYLWKVGTPPPHLDRHSQTKHSIVEEYVRQYVMTLMAPANIPELRLSIIDGFCGGGCYQTEDGGLADGSPLLVMRAVREARARLNLTRRNPRNINVEYYFVDILPETTSHLKYWLEAKRSENAIDQVDYDNTEIITNGFLQSLPYLVQKVQKRKMGEHAIFVLDQYSYKDIPLPEIAGILRTLKGAEVVMTFNVDNLTTYLSDHAANRKSVENIGLDKHIPWADLKLLKATHKQEWRQILQRHLAHGIKCETGAKFMTLFFVKPQGENSWGYWLIHLSNEYRAHAVMKLLHWEHATEFGHELEPGVFVLGYNANKDSDYTGQQTFEFAGVGAKEACIDGVREHFGKTIFQLDKPIRLGDLFQSCVTNSTAAETHLMEAARQLHASKNVIIASKDGSTIRRNNKAYKLSDVIEPSKQILLFSQSKSKPL
ncbi:MAG: three-Cys-motif partner protein TcmP [Methylotenera sp.]|nr:three-Cys-motif partner protein TcmP [Methylotenera sp.]MDP2282328.1 three-Cys-motif partner protein TcmP [Methylotenera sp.]MDP3061432.1 three-Cys-motif partner protein TcmP [Methylotenera sp.]